MARVAFSRSFAVARVWQRLEFGAETQHSEAKQQRENMFVRFCFVVSLLCSLMQLKPMIKPNKEHVINIFTT